MFLSTVETLSICMRMQFLANKKYESSKLNIYHFLCCRIKNPNTQRKIIIDEVKMHAHENRIPFKVKKSNIFKGKERPSARGLNANFIIKKSIRISVRYSHCPNCNFTTAKYHISQTFSLTLRPEHHTLNFAKIM